MNPLAMPTIKVSQEQSADKIDDFKLSINFKSDPSKVRQIKLYSTFDYFCKAKLKMRMVGML